MTINNPVLFGLKVSNVFSDIQSKSTALNNLGLDIRDLAVINGISGKLTSDELQQVSGLDVNLTKYIDRLRSDTNQYSNLIRLSSGHPTTTRGNFEAFGAISGGAVRYKYIPNDKGDNVTSNELKFGDISTSRVSAWSGGSEATPNEAISYGASVQLRGSLKLGQSPTYNVPANESIWNVLGDPEPIRFDTEVPTEIIKINLNGQPAYVYAMRGIPQIFTTAFKSLTMSFGFQPYNVDGENKSPIFTFTETDTGLETVSNPSPISNVSTIKYNSSQFKEREMRVYFPPNNIKSLTANNCNLAVFPKVKYPNITNITLINNILTSIPDFATISYAPSYNADKTEIEEQNSILREINLQNNQFYLDDDLEQRFLGSNTMTRLPTSLYELNLRGCFQQHTAFLDAEDYLVLKVNSSEYNNVKIDTIEKQTFSFTIGTASNVQIKGLYFDKHNYTGVDPSVYYVYIKDPTRVGTTDTLETISSYQDNVEVLDLFTKCPRLRELNLNLLSSRRIYRTNNSRYVDVYNDDFYGYVDGVEITPRVNLRHMLNYSIHNCYFTKLNPIFENPANLGGLGADESPLVTFDVGENEALTSTGIDFQKMTSIRTININDTALPIPSGLTNRTTLTTVNCGYTRFPSRNPVAAHSSPGGQPEPQNNYLWSSTNPTALTEYIFAGCSSLRSLSFYQSRLDGMIPKFTGNDGLTSIDFRGTRIEGGRPGGQGASFNGGDHGRRYIMWDDTFQDAQKITSIRISSNNLGRNIGTYSPGNGPTYTGEDGTVKTSDYFGAEFQEGTFSLPTLKYLAIDTNGPYLTGSFFSINGAPALEELFSNGVGWGTAFTDGTPFPNFNSNANIYRVDLRNNKFKGTISLINLNKLRYFYASSNIIDTIGTLSNLGALNYFYVANNQIAGAVPDFSAGAPNLQFAGLNDNLFNAYNVGSLRTMTRIKSLDLSGNYLNTQNVDNILEDLLINYNTAKRRGVTINLKGDFMGAPSSIPITTPTSSTTKVGEETIVVNQDPITPITTFALQTLDIKDETVGTAPNDTIKYAKLFVDGVEVILPSAVVQLNYASDQVEFQPGFPPTQGTIIKVEQWQISNGTITTLTGGITIKTELLSKGWTVQTN